MAKKSCQRDFEKSQRRQFSTWNEHTSNAIPRGRIISDPNRQYQKAHDEKYN